MCMPNNEKYFPETCPDGLVVGSKKNSTDFPRPYQTAVRRMMGRTDAPFPFHDRFDAGSLKQIPDKKHYQRADRYGQVDTDTGRLEM